VVVRNHHLMAYCTESVKIKFFFLKQKGYASSYDRPAQTFVWCRQLEQFGLHARNVKFNTQNKE